MVSDTSSKLEQVFANKDNLTNLIEKHNVGVTIYLISAVYRINRVNIVVISNDKVRAKSEVLAKQYILIFLVRIYVIKTCFTGHFSAVH